MPDIQQPQPPFRKIIHVDMDAFFAAVELREHPELRGRPIAVGYDGPRGVVSTANYEARRYGVHSAMAIARAKQLCPHITIVPCHFDLYKEISAQVHEVFAEYTDIIEPLSIDEAFLDVTFNKIGAELAVDIAREIKEKIRQRTQLTASAGVSYCKFLAKVASDYRKPDGLYVVHPSRALDFIASLPIEDFWGVGPKTAERMHGLGIYRGEHLREMPLGLLLQHFGKAGRVYYDFARGIDNRPVQPTHIRKSMSCEETYATDIYDKQDVADALEALILDLAERLERKKFNGHTVTLKVKYFDFSNISRSLTAAMALRTADEIRPFARELLRHIEYSAERPIRLLGLGISNPDAPAPAQPLFPTLFD